MCPALRSKGKNKWLAAPATTATSSTSPRAGFETTPTATDGTATPGTQGLFGAGSGGRYATRAAPLGAPRLPAGTRYDIPASGGAVVGNIAVTDTAGPGFVQLGPSDTMVNGATSNINPTRAEETVANAFIVPTGSGGRMGVYTSNATHIVIDVTGYMTA